MWSEVVPSYASERVGRKKGGIVVLQGTGRPSSLKNSEDFKDDFFKSPMNFQVLGGKGGLSRRLPQLRRLNKITTVYDRCTGNGQSESKK